MEIAKRNSIITPIIVLVCIGLVASFLLAAVFQLTNPIILQREAEVRNAALKLVLPDGTSFSLIEDVEFIEGVTEVYKADNGAGYVCSTNCKSQQGGEVNMMIGVNSLNQVNGISIISHNETAGIGDKVLREDYLRNYYGISEVEMIDAVDAVSGATKTSNCVKDSAKAALKMVSSIVGELPSVLQ